MCCRIICLRPFKRHLTHLSTTFGSRVSGGGGRERNPPSRPEVPRLSRRCRVKVLTVSVGVALRCNSSYFELCNNDTVFMQQSQHDFDLVVMYPVRCPCLYFVLLRCNATPVKFQWCLRTSFRDERCIFGSYEGGISENTDNTAERKVIERLDSNAGDVPSMSPH